MWTFLQPHECGNSLRLGLLRPLMLKSSIVLCYTRQATLFSAMSGAISSTGQVLKQRFGMQISYYCCDNGNLHTDNIAKQLSPWLGHQQAKAGLGQTPPAKLYKNRMKTKWKHVERHQKTSWWDSALALWPFAVELATGTEATRDEVNHMNNDSHK